jgi:hypothetical protein
MRPSSVISCILITIGLLALVAAAVLIAIPGSVWSHHRYEKRRKEREELRRMGANDQTSSCGGVFPAIVVETERGVAPALPPPRRVHFADDHPAAPGAPPAPAPPPPPSQTPPQTTLAGITIKDPERLGALLGSANGKPPVVVVVTPTCPACKRFLHAVEAAVRVDVALASAVYSGAVVIAEFGAPGVASVVSAACGSLPSYVPAMYNPGSSTPWSTGVDVASVRAALTR